VGYPPAGCILSKQTPSTGSFHVSCLKVSGIQHSKRINAIAASWRYRGEGVGQYEDSPRLMGSTAKPIFSDGIKIDTGRIEEGKHHV
jgi:acyl-CoA thioesterase